MSVQTRRASAVALLAVLLCAFALVAPAAAHADGHHVKSHAVKIVTVTGADQHAGQLRLDQPQLPSAAPASRPAARFVHGTADATTTTSAGALDSTRTRGPPGDACF